MGAKKEAEKRLLDLTNKITNLESQYKRITAIHTVNEHLGKIKTLQYLLKRLKKLPFKKRILL